MRQIEISHKIEPYGFVSGNARNEKGIRDEVIRKVQNRNSYEESILLCEQIIKKVPAGTIFSKEEKKYDGKVVISEFRFISFDDQQGVLCSINQEEPVYQSIRSFCQTTGLIRRSEGNNFVENTPLIERLSSNNI